MRIVEARIEIPMGSQNKYEIDHKTGKIKLNRVLYSAAFYPAEYGFIEDTLSEDGDPLDILVLTSSPTFPGCYIDSRIIGAMDMVDSGEADTKLLAVNIGDPRYDYISSLDDVPPHLLLELENFFSTYKTLQHLKTEVRRFMNEEEAVAVLDRCYERYKEANAKGL